MDVKTAAIDGDTGQSGSHWATDSPLNWPVSLTDAGLNAVPTADGLTYIGHLALKAAQEPHCLPVIGTLAPAARPLTTTPVPDTFFRHSEPGRYLLIVFTGLMALIKLAPLLDRCLLLHRYSLTFLSVF